MAHNPGHQGGGNPGGGNPGGGNPGGGKPRNQEPEISFQSFSVNENSLTGTLVGTVVASDPDGDVLTYRIVGGNTNGAFVINASTGVITVANGSLLNHEDLDPHRLIVEVSDKKLATTAEIRIAVNDVNETPAGITLNNPSVDENASGAVVGILSVIDPDNSGVPFGQHSFTVNDFRFEVVDGQLKLMDDQTLDFETEPSVTIEVTATDGGGLSTTQSFTITVNDLQENVAPVAVDSLLVTKKNVGGGHLLTATDPDGNDFSFSLVDGPINGDLALDENGFYEYVPDPDFVGTDSFTFKATDDQGAESNVAAVNITVLQIFDTTPLTINGGPGNDFVIAGDGDDIISGGGGFDVLNGAFGADEVTGGPDADSFVLVRDETQGDVITDFEPGLDRLHFSGFAEDATLSNDGDLWTITSAFGSETFRLNGITTLNPADYTLETISNQAPTGIGIDNATVDENATGVVVGTLTVDDPNGDETIFGQHNFTVDDSRFEVVDRQLKLRDDETLDFETEPSVTLQVTATDGGGLSTSQSFTITINDVNEFSGVIDLATMTAADGFRIFGADSIDRWGINVASAGDVNGDGFDDLIIGAYRADAAGNLKNDAGESYVIFGKADGFNDIDLANPSPTDGFRIFGADSADRSGRFVSSAGDVNGDGFGDLIISAPLASAAGNLKFQAGEGYVIFGKADSFTDIDLASLAPAEGFRIFGADTGDRMALVSSAGDMNGDGFDDLSIGAYRADAAGNLKNDAGESYVIFGKADGFTDIDLANLAPAEGFRIFGTDSGDLSGYWLSSAGDVNNDGFDDLIIGARFADAAGNLKSDAGESYVIFGKASGFADIDLASMTPAEGFRIFGADSGDLSGYGLSSAGDVNGDGFDDLIIGAQLGDVAGNLKSDAGESYVIFGKASGFADIDLASLTPAEGFRIFGADSGDWSGFSVSTAGDVNGDGLDDLIIGARFADAAGNLKSDAGEGYVIFGKSGGFTDIDLASLGPAEGFRILGADPGDNLGISVAAAGDVNDDGFGDLILGATEADAVGNLKPSTGEGYIIFGRDFTGVASLSLADADVLM